MMLSRVAENLYWLARYLERAENTARLINATTMVLLDLPRGASFGWEVLIKVAGLDTEFNEHYAKATEQNIMRFLISDERNPGAIVSCIRRARENSRTLREVMPALAWERINGLYLFINENAAKAVARRQRQAVLDELIERRQSVVGLLADCMAQDVASHFLTLGRNIERADMTSRILDISAAVLVPRQQVPEDPVIGQLWMGVLKSLNAYQTYRQHCSVHVSDSRVVDYLLKNPKFPRAVQCCLNEVEHCLKELPHNDAPLKVFRVAQRRLQGMKLDNLSAVLRHEYLEAVQQDLALIHGQLAREYFHLHLQVQPDPRRAAVVAG
jgi:uncharacterized alpha-E superfamily protein